MPRRSIFYSFHFDNDVFRVQQVRNIGALEGNEPVSANDWETVKRGGSSAIERWIDANMNRRHCVIVLIGSETASREWVRYEIIKAWNEKRGLFGIHIHNLKCPRSGVCAKGPNPFEAITFTNGQPMSSVINTYDPDAFWSSAYADISSRLEGWVEAAITQAAQR